MKIHTTLLIIGVSGLLFARCSKDDEISSTPAVSEAELGEMIFNDKNLSNPVGVSCASCHAMNEAFSDQDHSITSPGAVDGVFGNRNSPTAMYSMFAPALHYDKHDDTYVGGLFLDGRVNNLEDQAKQPFFNPVEMNLTDKNMFVEKFKQESFYPAFVRLYGDITDTTKFLQKATEAIAAFERTDKFNQFTSKFDYYLKGKAKFTDDEAKGFELFKGKAMCANCHPNTKDEESGKVLFTDFTYDNIGVPKNAENPFYSNPPQYNPDGAAFVDYGLENTTHSKKNRGQFKVPSLRNIALTAPYFHNGVFKTLEEVVHFYNKRNEENIVPEAKENVNKEELGDLNLTADEEKQLVAFLNTLTDGYKP